MEFEAEAEPVEDIDLESFGTKKKKKKKRGGLENMDDVEEALPAGDMGVADIDENTDLDLETFGKKKSKKGKKKPKDLDELDDMDEDKENEDDTNTDPWKVSTYPR